MSRRLTIAGLALALIAAILPAFAQAAWQGPQGNGAARSKATALNPGSEPTVAVNGRNVTLDWAAAGGSTPIEGYLVRRFDAGGSPVTVGNGCSGTVITTTCTETGVAPGAWTYTVTPVKGNWRGSESDAAPATVAAPALSLAPASVSSLPSTLSGQLSGFASGQTVSFRLDNASSGPLLSGSVTPTPIPANGTANVSVTLPAGTSTGAHTIFALGSGGDQASAAVTVTATSRTVTTSAWDLRDASAGSESNASDPIAFSSDGRTYETATALSGFSTLKYLTIDLNSALPANAEPTAATFNLRFASQGGGTACVYSELRRASTNALLSTNGSSSNPAACVSGASLQNFSLPLSDVDSAEAANDLRLRVYFRESNFATVIFDRANVSVASSQGNFELYDEDFTERRALSGTLDNQWPLVASGDRTLTSAQPWQASFNSGRYLKLDFPAYVPAGSAVSGATLKHSYRSAATSGQVCVYYAITLAGTTVNKGSSGSPYSCTSSASSWVTDSIAIPEVNSVARANDVVVRVFVRTTNTARSQHDLAELRVEYAN